MRSLQRAFQTAALASEAGTSLAEARVGRRRFLQGAAGAAGAGLLSACGAGLPVGALARGLDIPGVKATRARVAVVGGGLAGLTAAHDLAAAGVDVTLYEASTRAGGRVYSAHDLLAPGLTTELGAEFIDSSHKVMLALARELGLSLLDVTTDAKLAANVYFYNGQHYTDRDLARAAAAFLPRLAHDQASLPDVYGYHNPGAWTAFDRLSLAAYLDGVGIDGWVRALIETCYTTEMGLEPQEQSALNFLGLVGTKLVNGNVQLVGASDERYKVRGGNQQVPLGLAARLGDRVRYGCRLERVAKQGSGYRLSFAVANGPGQETDVDAVILAVPFGVLRQVAIDVPMPAVKQRAIAELGYGTNSKLLLGFNQRVWRADGYLGGYMADGGLQNGWDDSQLQPGAPGGLTIFLGGRAGATLGQGSASDQAARRLDELEALYPGAKAAYSGTAHRIVWPDEPLIRGSYACFKPGQYAAFHGAEGEPVGRLFFAGEHCSNEFQGYMEGAAETGRKAAAAAIKALGAARA